MPVSYIKRATDASRQELRQLVPFLQAMKATSVRARADAVDELAARHRVSRQLLERALYLYCERDGRCWLTGRGLSLLAAAERTGSEADTSIQVEVLPHAIDRALQRNLVRGSTRREIRSQIVDEVRRAIAHGRHARDQPRWVRSSTGAGKDSPVPSRLFNAENQRYVWDERGMHVWIALKDGGRWTVVTGIRRLSVPRS